MNDPYEPVARPKTLEEIEKEIDAEIRKLRKMQEKAKHVMPLLGDMDAPPDLLHREHDKPSK